MQLERGSNDGCLLLRLLGKVFDCPSLRPKNTTMVIYVGPVRDRTSKFPPNRKEPIMAEKIGKQQEFDVTIGNSKDARGGDAPLDAATPPTWESSDPNVVDVRVAADGMSAIIGSLDAEGSVVVTVTADGRMGEEVVPVIGTLSVVVAAGDVVSFDLTAGPARDRT